MNSRRLNTSVFVAGCTLVIMTVVIRSSILPFPATLTPDVSTPTKRQVLDRLGAPLSYTFTSGWNTTAHTPLHRIPSLLQRACIEAEDRRFFEHSGVDWFARLHAVWQNIRALRVIRGASTITEQVVRMLHPRPRSLGARLIEGFEARTLEQRFSKADILEFYLNQAPFAANRRGVSQAARYFWDRDLDTLTEREQISLAVMMRAPGVLSLYRSKPSQLQARVATLAERLVSVGALTHNQLSQIISEETETRSEVVSVRADHFTRYVQGRAPGDVTAQSIHSTLDSSVQRAVQEVLETRLKDLAAQRVTDGAALVVDNRSAEVLAWVNAGAFSELPGSQIDAIITPRQPGSTLKPFLYALALQRGWSAATTINDSPLAEPVGAGLHTYRNYSRVHYGALSLRDALGNSLNVPAIRTVQFTGSESFLRVLHALGFASLTQPADFYGEGLALGNGEVTLLELVRGYLTLAHRGVARPLVLTRGQHGRLGAQSTRIFDTEVSSLIGNILSDPHARRFEFGSDGLLDFPVQTAVKTGTSTDYRDAWAVGFSDDFTAGVWMGNLDRTAMAAVSGARGPALVLRSIFALLQNQRNARGLYLSPRLERKAVCAATGLLPSTHCRSVSELFAPDSAPLMTCAEHHPDNEQLTVTATTLKTSPGEISARITVPTHGLHIAMDPRIPDSKEALAFELTATTPLAEIEWIVNGAIVHHSHGERTRYLWQLSRGQHRVGARVRARGSDESVTLKEVEFWVR